MPALNFTSHNAPLVAGGLKPHTIRQQRKRPFQPGDTLTHYTGQRTPNCRPLGQSTAAVVLDCIIDPVLGQVTLGGVVIPCRRVLLLAQADGFDSTEAFFRFFHRGLAGQLIGWESITTTTGEIIPTTLRELDYLP